ncbi:MAG TPA: FHA domain-containing protein [Solirubrobacteraceae bacterium]|nr:FHA domain-containing protein [Solirubrobacteraceae bacterium]
MPPSDHTLHQPADARLAERETHGMSTGQPLVVDSLSLLDHRTREQTIPAADAPAGRYLSIEGEDGVRLLPLTRPITHIGRGLVADVRFEDAHVSRRHAIVAVRGSAVRILDDRSSGGTFVNGRRVSSAELADGDVVRVGRAVFRYAEVAPTGAGERGRSPRRVPAPSLRRRRVVPGGARRTASADRRS